MFWSELTRADNHNYNAGQEGERRGSVRGEERSYLLKGQSSLPRTDSAASTLIFSLELNKAIELI